MRETSNPVFRSLPKQRGGYAQFGTGPAQMQAYQANPYAPYQEATASRPMTIDDVVTKTGITLAVLTVVGAVSFFMVASNHALALPFLAIGGLGAFVLVMIAIFARKQDNPAIVLSYAVLEGLALGAFSFVLTFPVRVGGQATSAGMMIGQAIAGTLGVMFGMLVVYKTGAIRVTPRFTRMVIAAGFGVVVLVFVNALLAIFGVNGGAGLGIRGGPHDAGIPWLAVLFSLVAICVGAFFFLLDFDEADQLIRAGAPEKAAWSVALGLTLTLVWVYTEILRLITYFQSD
ncbi:hypothetical protein A5791_04980 [Mycobacterium sp. 852002-51163_SCH5372311]|uniref:Bax inhibitor-1/YccA family protein n=1 Tax=Mycobacterium sp. 852002-51163_SCH5372311 TaxID=1834097 RepID=UPI0007FE145F|nr:Bax inhibitor-1/YccA family protein [Mycobacterium sp. 852002-51163_SCH5372311]OBF81926.1 hypothetical protein A5791_04980 [Mycobacterium sp. 852002-51163_SCH5372311]